MILVAGGAGYIGAHCCKLLAARGYQTLVVDNFVRGHQEFVKWSKIEAADLLDVTRLRQIFRAYSIEAVIDFASFIFVGESVRDPQRYYANNLGATLNLLQVMLEHQVKNIVFSSSCAIYGQTNVQTLAQTRTPIIDENQRIEPITPYGRSKWMIEQILEDYRQAYGLNYIAMRYFNAAGADPEGEIGEWHIPENHLIPLVLDVALGKAAAIKIWGDDYPTADGTCVRDYVHVADLANAHLAALEYLKQHQVSDCFNLGTGQGHSVRQVVEAATRVTGCQIPVVIEPRRAQEAAILIANPAKAQRLLNWHPQYTQLAKIIQTAWQWQRRELGTVSSL